MARVTVFGMGAMGSRIAMLLLKAGHEVAVWNRSIEKTAPLIAAGAKIADTPCSAACDADFAISMVRDDHASQQVWLAPKSGALMGLPKHAIVIESSTVTVPHIQALNKACAAHGIAFIDAPVAGSRPQAEAAQLIYLLGGDVSTVTKVEPILKTLSGAVHHVGPVGSGAALKLVINSLFGVQVAVIAELIALMQRCGLDVAKAIEIIAATPVCSPAAKTAANAMLAGNFVPMFPLELVAKDFSYVLEMAATNATQLPITQAAAHLFAAAVAGGLGGDNITGVMQLYLES